MYCRFGNLTFTVRTMGNPSGHGWTELRSIMMGKEFYSVNTTHYKHPVVCPYCESHLDYHRHLTEGLSPYEYAIYALASSAEINRNEYSRFGNLLFSTECATTGSITANRQHAQSEEWSGQRFDRFPYELRFLFKEKLIRITCLSDEHLGDRRDAEGRPILQPHGCPSEFYVVGPPRHSEEGQYFYTRFGNMICAVTDEVFLDPDAMKELEYVQHISPYHYRFIDSPFRDDFKCPLCGHLIPEENKTILEEKSVAPYLALSPRE